MDKHIALIGLGAVGVPIANILFKHYGDDFILLSSKDFLYTLVEKDIYINNELFSPIIVSDSAQLKKRIGLLIVTVKNYHIVSACSFLKDIIDDETIILPLQNGVYSHEYFRSNFPNNIILEGFAKGPNTIITRNGFGYQKAGTIHIGSTQLENQGAAKKVCSILKDSSIECYYDDDIRKEIWKKLMLNVGGNAITAITGIDYCDFRNSPEVQELCKRTMLEFEQVAKCNGIELDDEDIQEVLNYYMSFRVSKHTSMLEDVLHERKTENEYIAGYISKLAEKFGIYTPNIDMLYNLVKIKEYVYLKKR